MQTQAEILQNINQKKNRHFYAKNFEKATTQLQKNLQALNEHLGAIARLPMQYATAVANMMNDVVNRIGELTQAIAEVKDIDCPAELALLSQQEKALMTVCKDVDTIQQLLINNVTLYDSDNYAESYSICQALQQYFVILEQVCVAICRAANTLGLESVMQSVSCAKIIALNETLMQQLKSTYQQLTYRQAYQQTLLPLQKTLQALNHYISAHTTEDAFLKYIYNGIIFEIFMENIVKHVNALAGAMKTLNAIESPAVLELLTRQEKALARMGGDIVIIQQELIANSAQYGIYNYSQCYIIYQGMKQYFNMLETVCISICGAANIAQLEQLLQSDIYHMVNVFGEKLIQMLATGDIKFNSETQSAPIASTDTVDIYEVTSINDESHDAMSQIGAGGAIKEVTIANESAGAPSMELDISKSPSWGNHTKDNFLTTLPAEILQVIADYLDPISLFALVISDKQSAKKLFNMLLQKQQLPSLITYPFNTYLYTSQAIYVCGRNDDGLLGIASERNLNTTHRPDIIRYFTRIHGISGEILQVAVDSSTPISSASGSDTSMLVHTTTGLYVRGKNKNGELGLGHKDKQPNFTRITEIKGKILQVVAGAGYSLMWTTAGLYGCGANYSGLLGLGNKKRQLTFTLLPGIEGEILKIVDTHSASHTLVLTTKGLYGSGDNQQGQLGLGSLLCSQSFVRLPGIEGDILHVVATKDRTFVLTTKGLYGCGYAEKGELGLGRAVTCSRQFSRIPGIEGKILQIVADRSHTFVLTTKGLFGCGNNFTYGQLGYRQYQNIYIFTLIPGIEGQVLQIATTYSHTIVLTTEGLYGCGNNQDGQLGLRHRNNQVAFTRLSGVEGNVIKIAVAMTAHTLVLTTKGLYGCGHNDLGQVGLNKLRRYSTFKKIDFPYLDKGLEAYSHRSILQATLNKTTAEGQPALPNPEVPKVAIQEISITNKSKAYLIQLHLSVASESQKQNALQQLQEDINNITTLQALFDLFMRVKQADMGILRQHRKNLIHVYGETDSYKQALKYFITKMLAFLNSTMTLKACGQLHVIMFEARRCQLPGEDWTQKLSEIKMLAAKIFQAELAAQKDLAGILDLFASINVQQPHGQTHILRLERKNILHAYGDTDTYKQALFALAGKAVDAAFPISDDQEIRKMQMQSLKQLKENLQAVKPYFNKAWQALLDKLEQKIVQAHSTAANAKSSSNIAVMRLAGSEKR